MTQPTLINWHPNECTQRYVALKVLRYYTFAVNLERCVGCCNTLNDLSNKLCVPNKAEDLYLIIFKMITGKN